METPASPKSLRLGKHKNWICIFNSCFTKKYPGNVPSVTKALARGLSSPPMGCQLSALKAVREMPVLSVSLRGVPPGRAATLHSPHCHIWQEVPQAQSCCRGWLLCWRPTEDRYMAPLPYVSEGLAQIPAPCGDGGSLGHQCVPCAEYSRWPVIDIFDK